ncbi:MAG: putative O-glycosylation ligase, exosortase A system-associated [Gammaproteobacteria bacterium]|nr:putative O-glycosylation ligase, exosortase A system-associated [Gammaproteobacteria bacterium]MBU1978564.1 putative O-glycosylation ligase, exosortase A system-associated [Gammaproteobacteria bacterium]
MRDIFVTVVVFGALLLVFKHPHYGIYLWSWLGYMNPHKLAWGFALNIPFALMTAVVTLTVYLLSKEPKRLPWTPETILLVVFLGWVTFTTFFAFYPQLAWEQWDKVLKIQIMTLLTAMLITNRKRLEGLVWVIALSIAFYGVKGGIFTILKGGVYHVQGPATTFIAGNNELGLAMIMTIPLLRYLHLQAQNKLIRLGLAASMVLTGLAAIGTQSRGALLAAAAMGGLLWLKSRNKATTAIYIVMAVGLIAVIMPQEYWDRMHTIKTYQEDASAMGRINAWHTAFNVAKDHITGGGFEAFQAPTFGLYAPDPDNVHDVHSIYFEVLGEHGFIGLGIFLLIGLLAWRTGSKVIRECRREPDRKWAADLAAMTQVSMVGYATGGAFLGLAYFDYYYHLVIILVLTYQIAIKNTWGTLGQDKPADSGASQATRLTSVFGRSA